MNDLRSLFSPDVLAALERLVDERIAEAFADRDREPQKRWLTPAEAASYLGTTPRAIYQRVRRHRIPEGAVRHSGRSLLIDRLALDRALERI